jgi:choloylglycine hydrolase
LTFATDIVKKCNEQLTFMPFSSLTKGRGSVGLPGDYTSSSRFVRASFLAACATLPHSEEEAVQRLFHLLDAVALPDGSVRTDVGCDITQYTAAMALTAPSYSYTTHTNRRQTHIRLSHLPLDCESLLVFPLRLQEDILEENERSGTRIPNESILETSQILP